MRSLYVWGNYNDGSVTAIDFPGRYFWLLLLDLLSKDAGGWQKSDGKVCGGSGGGGERKREGEGESVSEWVMGSVCFEQRVLKV